MEDGVWSESAGTPRGASASPLLANVYLYYALDLWVVWWRRRRARGDMIIVRFADDFICGTIAKRLRAALSRVKDQVKSRMQPIPEQGRWLASVIRGHMAYYAVPGSFRAVAAFRDQVIRHWYKALRRRSQRTTVTWERLNRYQARWLPRARITHPYPDARFDARTQGRSPVR